ncbi:nuclease [bacterium]|nr:nuclease [bacterium]
MKKFLTGALAVSILLISSAPVFAETVMFNTQTLKFHKLTCKWAKKCTVNCIKIDRKEAIKRGGIPCKVCGG